MQNIKPSISRGRIDLPLAMHYCVLQWTAREQEIHYEGSYTLNEHIQRIAETPAERCAEIIRAKVQIAAYLWASDPVSPIGRRRPCVGRRRACAVGAGARIDCAAAASPTETADRLLRRSQAPRSGGRPVRTPQPAPSSSCPSSVHVADASRKPAAQHCHRSAMSLT